MSNAKWFRVVAAVFGIPTVEDRDPNYPKGLER